ncbi:MAG: YraN family protein [Chitinophagales bacterium]|nr:YraN family protein [Chitinophagales bacterium]
MSKHNELGVKGEILALEFLEKKGYVILEINWRFSHTEVDIIAKQPNTLVIVEVKTRTGDQFGFPEEAVGIEKQKNLARAADEYLERNNLDMDVRFDVISITFKNDLPNIYHIQDAFFPYEV